MPRGRGSGATPETAKRDYVAHTTADVFQSGVDDAVREGFYSDGIRSFIGAAPSSQIVGRWQDGVRAKGSRYQDATDNGAADRWYDNYVRAMTRGGR